MEKIIEVGCISFQPTKNNKDKWVVASTNNTGNLSIWDGKIAEDLNKRIGQKVSVEVRPAQEGTNYLPTITGINSASDGTVDMTSAKKGVRMETETRPDGTSQSVAKFPPQQLPNSRDKQILAAVLLKGAVELAKKTEHTTIQDDARFMCECIPELYGVYKVALSVQDE